jgi:hypothetical protein
MYLTQVIEQAYWDQKHLDANDRWIIAQAFAKREWVALTTQFLENLDPHHTLVGTTVNTLCGICDYWRECQDLTPTQLMFLVHHVIENWHQTSYAYRSRCVY